MKHLFPGTYLFLVCFAFNVITARGQAVSEEWLKSEYTILLAGYISWPDEDKIDTFRLGVYYSESIFTQLSLKSEIQVLKGKPFRVIYFRKFRDIRPVDLLYIDEKKNNSLRKISQQFSGQPVLLVTDSAKSSEFTMLNILGMNLGGDKPFNLNKTNIDNAGLVVSPKILFFGGNEDDLRDIYRELKIEEDKLMAELDTLNSELAQKQMELAESEKKLEERSEEVDRLIREIDIQTEALTTLSDSVDLKQMDLVEKIRLLADQEKRVKLREEEINELNTDIAAKEQEILERSAVIDRQLGDIELQQAMMEEQQKILDSQKIQIERQKMVLLFFLILSVLILGMGFVIYRAYRIKKRANRILREKNQVIEEQKHNILNQKEEIQAQRDILQEVNVKIERQNENITASIYYALTIQQAMLPDIDAIKKLFGGFIIYLPKDIVSGDFYWFAQRGKRRT